MSRRRNKEFPPNTDHMVSLKVDNLTYRTTMESLRRVFNRYGEIGDIYIPRDRYTFESRGFAFVRYYDQRDADDAIDAMDGTMLDGRELRVQQAKHPRPINHGSKRPRRSRSRSRRRSRSHSRSRSRSRRNRTRSRSLNRRHDSREKRRVRSRDRKNSREKSRDRSHDKPRISSRDKSREMSRDKSRDLSRDKSRDKSHEQSPVRKENAHDSGEDKGNELNGVNGERRDWNDERRSASIE